MEPLDGEVAEKENVELTVDFSKQALKRIERADSEQQSAVALILDNNEIQKLDNLETYSSLEKLSVVNNQLIRMYGVSQLVHLISLDLSNNLLVSIEGLKELKELKYLYLSKNRIKTMEHLNRNLKLEKIDLSENNIMRISDVSYLVNLKELKLHGNRVSHLLQCDKYLPSSLEVLTLNNNSLADLNEISYLGHLISLRELSIVNNPCLDFSEDQKFNYRPYVKNWCSNLIVLDNSPLDDIECLKAEWLYSQGRGRSFRPGEHAALIEYLISVCPREKEAEAETEDVKKLKLILSKAQLHQQQLREQLSTGKFTGEEGKSSAPKKKSGLPERMVTSFQDSPSKDFRQNSDVMSQSLDSGIIRKQTKIHKPELNQTPLQTSTTFIPIPDTLISPDVGQPVNSCYVTVSSISSRTSRSSSRNSQHSTPEAKHKTSVSAFPRHIENSSPVSLKTSGRLTNSRSSTPLDPGESPRRNLTLRKIYSAGKKGSVTRDSDRSHRETSEDEGSDILAVKVKAAPKRASQGKQSKPQQTKNPEGVKEAEQKNPEKDLKDTKAWKAAVCIQRRWRGYRARNLNRKVLSGCKNIQMSRMQDYITKVVSDMEATRVALEGNRKLVILQMQAINTLWKKMTSLQPSVGSNLDENKVSLQNLVETCSNLNKQVEELQVMMKAMQGSSGSSSLIPIATQTEIVAVHTPQGENKETFPYNPNLKPVDNHPSIDSTEAKEYGNDSNCTVNTEYYVSPKDSSNEESSTSSGQINSELPFQTENLSKPAVKLQNSEESTEIIEKSANDAGGS